MTSKIELTYDQVMQLVEIRGGCLCFTGCAPCWRCAEPPNEVELEEIGYEYPIDYMKHIRDMCK